MASTRTWRNTPSTRTLTWNSIWIILHKPEHELHLTCLTRHDPQTLLNKWVSGQWVTCNLFQAENLIIFNKIKLKIRTRYRITEGYVANFGGDYKDKHLKLSLEIKTAMKMWAKSTRISIYIYSRINFLVSSYDYAMLLWSLSFNLMLMASTNNLVLGSETIPFDIILL